MQNSSFFPRLADKLIFSIILAAAFLIPLFFLPFSTEVFDFNKQILFLVLTLISALLWLAKGVYQRRIKITRTPLDVVLLIFLLVYTISTIFSLDWLQSLVGISGGGGLSLLTVVLLVIFYFIAVDVLNSVLRVKKVIYSLIISAVLASLFFILSLFNINLFTAFLSAPLNTIGSQSGLVSFLAVIFPFCLVLFLDKKNAHKSWLFFAPMLLFLLVLNTIDFKIGWLALSASVFIVLVFVVSRYNSLSLRFNWLWFSILVLTFSLLSMLMSQEINPVINSFRAQENKIKLPAEVSLSRGISWQIAKSTILSDPIRLLAGSGPRSFIYDFSKLRPENFNNNALWQIRFNQAGNHFYEVLATLGILGLLSWLSLLFLVIGSTLFLVMRIKPPDRIDRTDKTNADRFSIKKSSSALGQIAEKLKNKEQPKENYQFLLIGLLGALAGFLIMMWFSLPGIGLLIIFWLVMILIIRLSILAYPKDFKDISFTFQSSPKSSLIFSFGFVFVFVLLIFLGTWIIKVYLADYYYKQSLSYLNQPQVSQEELARIQQKIDKAINYNRFEADYYMLSARISLRQAVDEANKREEADSDKTSFYLAQAINKSKQAVRLNPQNVVVWQTRGDIFRNSRPFVSSAGEWAVKSYSQAVELEPSNPLLYNFLGESEFMESLDEKGDIADLELLNQAVEHLQQAVQLKSNYLIARMNLAKALEKQELADEAVGVLRAGLLFEQAQNSAELYYELGRLLYNRAAGANAQDADLENAVRSLEKTLELSPQYANALYSLSLAYERQGKLPEALAKMQEVGKLNPDNQEVVNKIKTLERKVKPQEREETEEGA